MRLDPIQDADWPEALADLAGGFATKLNVYRVMAHHPALLRAWRDLRTHVVTQSTLPPRWQEIVILRAAHRLAVPYEWAHHVVRGRAAGLSDGEIAAIRSDGDWGREPAAPHLLAAVDGLVATARIPADTLPRLATHLSKEQVLDLIATVGMYTTLAGIIQTFAVPLEPEIAAQTGD